MHFRALRKRSSDISLSETLDTDTDGNALSLLDVLSCEDLGLQQVEDDDRYCQIYRIAASCLTKRERDILFLRYGLGGGTALTQREVAGQKGISRSYVSRIEKKALQKLRTALEKT